MEVLIKGFLVATGWAGMITLTALAMDVFGFGKPNICEGETLIGFYSFLFFMSWITVPMAAVFLSFLLFIMKFAKRSY